jgi:hypothetical protein
MTTKTYATRGFALFASMITLGLSLNADADDVVSFSTGGYAAGLRTKEMMNIIDTDGDGTISRAEWDDFQEKVFKALVEPSRRGRHDRPIWRSPQAIGTRGNDGSRPAADGNEWQLLSTRIYPRSA